MSHILKSKNLQIEIDSPLENYNFSRFDWTGKIVEVKFKNKLLSSVERTDIQNENYFGKGFYNEFGIDSALGFEETKIGGWFHKIGVGLLKKVNSTYLFHENYEIKPAEFKIHIEPDHIVIHCTSEAMNGYSYILTKKIVVKENGFSMSYILENTGVKDIITDEYAHNFTAVQQDLIGPNYILNFPFPLKQALFKETVNPEEKVVFGQNEITLNATPEEQFFFSNLTGSKNVAAKWKLINLKNNIAISEIGSFQTNKINLWGWKHVISPELFFNINIKPGQSAKWSRNYKVYTIN